MSYQQLVQTGVAVCKAPEMTWEGDLFSTGTVLASRQIAPATTGEATLVPESERQPPWILLPITSLPYATTSGCSIYSLASEGSASRPSTLVGDNGDIFDVKHS